MNKGLAVFIKILLTVAVVFALPWVAFYLAIMLISININLVIAIISVVLLPSLLPLIWLRRKKKYFLVWGACILLYCAALGTNFGINKYNEKITVNTTPNINVNEYLPFNEQSKIVKLDSTMKLDEPLPKIDGAAALFPVYSAFVNATYPETTELSDEGAFQYNNTVRGYDFLAQRKTDVFIGAYPSDEQIDYARQNGTSFEYIPIGKEAFVFFVHKNNPIDDLTTEQLKGIYSGKIKNWRQLDGKNQEIVAFQRNEGSGSQSMLRRFMGDTPIMEAPKESRVDLMSGIIEVVSSYKSKTNAIGFSFRYYVEEIVQNPDIKIISVDGVAPTAENIKNGKYPLASQFYAVTYEQNSNSNTKKLIEWILSDEGQEIIERTGYVAIK